MSDPLSRRDALLGGATLAAGVGAALAVSTVGSTAHAQSAADATALNTLLLETWKAVRAYTYVVGNVLASPASSDPLMANAQALTSLANRFKTQHQETAAKLSQLVTAAGGTPIAETAATTVFNWPAGAGLSIGNGVKVLSNTEKRLSITFTDALKNVGTATGAAAVSSSGATCTQRFIALFLFAKTWVQLGSGNALSEVVPRGQVVAENSASGLHGLADLSINAAS